jgi:hypothetical protein
LADQGVRLIAPSHTPTWVQPYPYLLQAIGLGFNAPHVSGCKANCFQRSDTGRWAARRQKARSRTISCLRPHLHRPKISVDTLRSQSLFVTYARFTLSIIPAARHSITLRHRTTTPLGSPIGIATKHTAMVCLSSILGFALASLLTLSNAQSEPKKHVAADSAGQGGYHRLPTTPTARSLVLGRTVPLVPVPGSKEKRQDSCTGTSSSTFIFDFMQPN